MPATRAAGDPGAPGGHVRRAAPEDLPAIVRIYNHAVTDTVATFDLAPWRVEDRRSWLASFDDVHPCLVYEIAGVVVGYAYYVAYRARPAYDGSKESSIYVDPARQGRGVGRALYEALLAHAQARGVHVMVAVLGGDNAASEALHRRLGFAYVGRLREVGRKFNRWVDTPIFQRVL